MGCPFDIYEYFNSRDILEYCSKIKYDFSCIEAAYLVWHSNHHTLVEKHIAWQIIIDTMPDESFHRNWDFNGHTLHSFLKTYMDLQNEFITNFCTPSTDYIYTYSSSQYPNDEYDFDNIFFNSYEACVTSLKKYIVDSNPYDEITKVKISRQRLYSSSTSFDEAISSESIIFNKHLQILDIEASNRETEKDNHFLLPPHGFYGMWVAIPSPFKRGDIVTDINSYDKNAKKHTPLLLERIPYWKCNAENGDDCTEHIEQLLNIGVDWTDMQAGFWFQDNNGEIYWDHGYDYLDLEYYRDELVGVETFLFAVSSYMQGKIRIEELLQAHSVILMENYAKEMKQYFGENQIIKQYLVNAPTSTNAEPKQKSENSLPCFGDSMERESEQAK